jgi:hypothetical protein
MLFGEQVGKHVLGLLSLLELLVYIQNQRLNEDLCLLATYLPNGIAI